MKQFLAVCFIVGCCFDNARSQFNMGQGGESTTASSGGSAGGTDIFSSTKYIDLPCDADRVIERGDGFVRYHWNTTNYPMNYPNNDWCEAQLRNNDYDNVTIIITCTTPNFHDENDNIEFFYDSMPIFGMATYAKEFQFDPTAEKGISYVVNVHRYATLSAVFQSDSFGTSNGTACSFGVFPDSSTRMEDLSAMQERALATPAEERDVVEDAILGVLTDDINLIDPGHAELSELFSTSGTEVNCSGSQDIARFAPYYIQTPNYPNNYPNNDGCMYQFKNPDNLLLKFVMICNPRETYDKGDKLSFYYDDNYFFGAPAWKEKYKGGPPSMSGSLSYQLGFAQHKTLNITFKSDSMGSDPGVKCTFIGI